MENLSDTQDSMQGMGLVTRLALLMTNYRKPLDWNDKRQADALHTWNKWMDGLEGHFPNMRIDTSDFIEDYEIVANLSDDLNTVAAIARLNVLAAKAKKGDRDSAQRLAFGMHLMGFIPDNMPTGGGE